MSSIATLPVLVAAAAYWALGALWYSVLFGGIWSKGLSSQGIKLAKPTKGEMTSRFIGAFVANLVTAIAVAWIIQATGTQDSMRAVKIGLLAGVGFVGMALASAYAWESKPLANLLVDASYHTLGVILCAVIVTAWR